MEPIGDALLVLERTLFRDANKEEVVKTPRGHCEIDTLLKKARAFFSLNSPFL